MDTKLNCSMLAICLLVVLCNEQLNVRALEQPHVHAQVAFSGDQVISPNHKIIFKQPIDIRGSAYSTDTGVFKAPYEGTYLFSVNMCQGIGKVWSLFHIKKDGNRLSTGLFGDMALGSCGSATAVTYMKMGSEVWVEAGLNSKGHAMTIKAAHTFTGVLLNKK